MKTSPGVLIPKMLLMFLALIVGLAVVEGFLRAFVPVRNVGPAFTAYDPVYGKSLKRAFAARRITPEFEMHFATNSHGHRGPELNDIVQKPILFVGDSFTMGYGVSDGFEFPALVASSLHEIDGATAAPIVNLGMGNNGNGRPLKLLRDQGEAFDPSLIVLQLTENDFKDNLREQLFALDQTSNELIELGVPAPGMLNKLQAGIEKIPGLADTYLVGFLRQAVTDFSRTRRGARKDKGSLDRRHDPLTLRLVEEILSLSKKNHWPIVVLSAGIEGERLAAVQELCEHHAVDLLPIASKRQQPDLYYVVDSHWNAGGHAHVADLMLDWLQQEPQVWSQLSNSE